MPPRKFNPRRQGIEVSLVNEQAAHAVDEGQLVDAVRAVVHDAAFRSAAISIAIVDDPTMHELNRQYLEHDYPTDVLSFVLSEDDNHLEGEVIISADTAAAEAAAIGWPAAAEQLLYAIHGALHLVGYRDKAPAEAREMREAEARYLRMFRFEQPQGPPDPEAGGQRGPISSRPGATSR